MKNKKRFIAGATCPQCHYLDSVYLSIENDKEVIKCTECTYYEDQKQEKDDNQASNQPSEKVIGIFKQ